MSFNSKDIPIPTKRVIRVTGKVPREMYCIGGGLLCCLQTLIDPGTTRSISSLLKSDTSQQRDNLPQLNSEIKKLTINKASDNHLFSKNLLTTQKSQPLSPSNTSISTLDSDLLERSTNTSGSFSNEITIFSPNQVLDISTCPCYNVTKDHPINPSWANFAAFHTHLISTPKKDERLFSFLADLVSEILSQTQTVVSLNSEIKFLHQQQISLEKNRSSLQDLKIIFNHCKKEIIKNRDDAIQRKNQCSSLESDLRDKNNELVVIREAYQTQSEEIIHGTNAGQADVASISDFDPHFTSRPACRDQSEKFSGADPEKYAIWRYEIDQKFEDDSVFLKNNQKQITYARAQLCGDFSIHMSNWKLTSPISNQILDNFFNEIEFFSGAVNLDEIARSELLTIKQKPSEKITQFYQRIAVLWTRAKYPESDRVRSFIYSEHPSLSRTILHMKFLRNENVLEALRTLEISKLGIETHQPRRALAQMNEDRENTAFVTPIGIFEGLVMLFGLCNAPATFQSLMEEVMEPFRPFIAGLLDDVAFWEHTIKELHVQLLQVLDSFALYGLLLNPAKCNLFVTTELFLGFVISENGITADPEKDSAIRDRPMPKTTSEIRGFVGAAGYLRFLMKNFSALASQLIKHFDLPMFIFKLQVLS
ncbi:hypothetical protein EPUL_004293 [Erysiphe pulchra]|uniref:Reverse transcriptase domain-containing protein n=1 Tax=Erysiphe pulchra TaxID=225359 RepID=A0A2S4PPX0_9PEZI|nr:hypothetical protein EPUL_004293 [Erysiphe pulchra]